MKNGYCLQFDYWNKCSPSSLSNSSGFKKSNFRNEENKRYLLLCFCLCIENVKRMSAVRFSTWNFHSILNACMSTCECECLYVPKYIVYAMVLKIDYNRKLSV